MVACSVSPPIGMAASKNLFRLELQGQQGMGHEEVGPHPPGKHTLAQQPMESNGAKKQRRISTSCLLLFPPPMQWTACALHCDGTCLQQGQGRLAGWLRRRSCKPAEDWRLAAAPGGRPTVRDCTTGADPTPFPAPKARRWLPALKTAPPTVWNLLRARKRMMEGKNWDVK